MNKNLPAQKMRVSFDLDEVLFVSPKTHKTEPPPPFPFNRLFVERLRLGAEAAAAGYRHRGQGVRKPVLQL